METIKKIALFLFVIFVLILFVWALYLPKENIQEKVLKTLETQKEKADVSFKNVTFSESLGDIRFWELKADSAILNKDTGLAELKTVKGVFFKDNKPTFYFISPMAKWNMQKKEIYLEDPVGYDLKKAKYLDRVDPAFRDKSITEEAAIIEKQKGTPGYWLKAEYLDWKLATQKVSCNKGLVLNGSDFKVTAQSLDGDLAFNELTLSGNPYALVSPSSQKQSTASIEAREFKFFNAKDSIVASREVKIVYMD
ncbi:MAG: LPS export ABC transporter periplasmic protein LptC, partial [Candidatus Saganbacteria bacterium]|nr:LPS export ABC transporter periplasmic protein LptC [Candidatus Saganbacteria bacterium]